MTKENDLVVITPRGLHLSRELPAWERDALRRLAAKLRRFIETFEANATDEESNERSRLCSAQRLSECKAQLADVLKRLGPDVAEKRKRA